MKRKLLKNLLILALLFSLKGYCQFSTTQKEYNSSGCLTSFELKYSVSSQKKYYLAIYGSTGLIERRSLGHKTAGNYSAGIINISSSVTVKIQKKRWLGTYSTYFAKKIVQCQNDIDGDGVLNVNDNCLNTSNENQGDIDNDGIGDVCDLQDNRDSDGDGIQNWKDQCPYQAGPTSNNGCTGNPDLTFDAANSNQFNDCYNCSGTISHIKSNNIIPVIYRFGGNITFKNLVIKNIGNNLPQKSVKIRFYFSKDNKISFDDIGIGKRTIPLQPLKPSESTCSYDNVGEPCNNVLQVSIDGKDIGDKLTYGNYYLIIIIDQENELNSESDRSNNTISFRVRYTGTKPRNKGLIKINDRFGNSIIKKTVDFEEEKEIIKNLPRGLYFINKNGDKTKIYNEN